MDEIGSVACLRVAIVALGGFSALLSVSWPVELEKPGPFFSSVHRFAQKVAQCTMVCVEQASTSLS
jgi:hypothetical protein